MGYRRNMRRERGSAGRERKKLLCIWRVSGRNKKGMDIPEVGEYHHYFLIILCPISNVHQRPSLALSTFSRVNYFSCVAEAFQRPLGHARGRKKMKGRKNEEPNSTTKWEETQQQKGKRAKEKMCGQVHSQVIKLKVHTSALRTVKVGVQRNTELYLAPHSGLWPSSPSPTMPRETCMTGQTGLLALPCNALNSYFDRPQCKGLA